jgi:hypothetical protein
MDRIIGQQARMAEVLGVQIPIPAEAMYDMLKRLPDIEMDVHIGFQEASNTAREAGFNQLMQFAGIGMPVPPEILVDASDAPYKEEVKAALKKQGMGQPNQAALQALGSSQGQGAAAGINKT